MGYLIQVISTRTGYKLRALPGQEKDGKEIAPDKNVQGPTDIRPIIGDETTGCDCKVLYTDDLIDRSSYYNAGTIFLLTDEQKSKVPSYDMAPSEGLAMYREYLSKGAISGGSTAVSLSDVDPESRLGKVIDKYEMPKFEDTGYYLKESLFYLMLRNIDRRINTIIYGHAGTGKTELVMLIAEQMGVDLTILDMGSALDPTATLVGVHRLVDGESVFDYSRFYHAIQKPGIILLDEISRAPENTTNLLLPCLDSRRTLYTDVASSEVEREVAVHPKCIFMATANVGAEYVGVNLLDKALLSRFFKIELEYPTTDEEVLILTNRHDISESNAKTVVDICNDIRMSCADGSLSKDVSLRESISCSEMIEDGYTVEQALNYVILPCFEGGIDGGERAIVAAKIKGK